MPPQPALPRASALAAPAPTSRQRRSADRRAHRATDPAPARWRAASAFRRCASWRASRRVAVDRRPGLPHAGGRPADRGPPALGPASAAARAACRAEPSLPPPDSRPVDVAGASELMRLATDRATSPSAPPAGRRAVRARTGCAARSAAPLGPHRASLCRYPIGRATSCCAAVALCARPGLPARARDILVANGCLEAISLCLRAVTQPGDVVALESPTYFGFPGDPRACTCARWRSRRIRAPGCRWTRCGWPSTPSRSRRCWRCRRSPTRWAPRCRWPSAASWREMVAERGIPLIEDVLYNDLAEQDDRRRAVKAFDTGGHVMICGSLLRRRWRRASAWAGSRPGAGARRCAGSRRLHSGGHTELLELAMADLLTQPGHGSATAGCAPPSPRGSTGRAA